MAHVRKQLRDWLKANLTGSTEAASRVYVRRTIPRPKAEGAALLIAVGQEASSETTMGGRQERLIRAVITAVVKDDSEAGEDTLDALGVFVEGKFSATPDLGGLAHAYEYLGAEFAFAEEGEKIYCTAAFTFEVMVHTEFTDPETAL